MKEPAGQIARFRIYPEKTSRLYYDVRVFTSVRATRAYLRHSPIPRTLGRSGLAMCSTFTAMVVSPTGRRTLPKCGEIVFPVRALRAGVIAHECTHAALGWARRIGLQFTAETVTRRGWVSPAEERFCYALGELNRQVAVQVWDRGLQG